jgi:hypothetical protein
MLIRPVEAELLHANARTDVQTDITNLIVAFGTSAIAPKNAPASLVSISQRKDVTHFLIFSGSDFVRTKSRQNAVATCNIPVYCK